MGIGPMQLLIILVIVALVFGTSRLRNMGKDLGSAVKGFKDAVKDGEEESKKGTAQLENRESSIIEGETVKSDLNEEEKK